jgi:hypothetical protein
MGGSNKWCSRRDLGGNVGTKYQSVCSAPVWAAVCSTASTYRILSYSSSQPLSGPGKFAKFAVIRLALSRVRNKVSRWT